MNYLTLVTIDLFRTNTLVTRYFIELPFTLLVTRDLLLILITYLLLVTYDFYNTLVTFIPY